MAVTMNGAKVAIREFRSTSQHEVGHSGDLNHTWALNADEIIMTPELNQLDPATANKKVVIKNLMNSAENPDVNYRSDTGTELLFGQLRYLINRVRAKARYTPEQIKSINPEDERNKVVPTEKE